ncbi:hemerythrin [Opitutaceae bacterium EW11]|nr:hemerythrin [Opitutaceae bacterium EW11]
MLTWSPEFETGVAMIDNDHQQLVKGLNDLERALADGQGSAKIANLLAFLEKYAAEHFRREEDCMQRHRCPVAAANEKAHQQFMAKFASAKARIAKSPGSSALVAIQTQRELSDWIVQHILRVDLHIKACIGEAR